MVRWSSHLIGKVTYLVTQDKSQVTHSASGCMKCPTGASQLEDSGCTGDAFIPLHFLDDPGDKFGPNF